MAPTVTMVNDGSFNTAEGEPQYARMLKEVDEPQASIDDLAKIDASFAKNPLSVTPTAPVVTSAPAVICSEAQHMQERRDKMNHAWRSLLFGELDPRIAEHRDLLTSTGGGATVGLEFNDFRVAALRNYAPLMDYVRRRDSDNGRGVHASVVSDIGSGMTYDPEGSTVPGIDPANITATFINTDTLSGGIQSTRNRLLMMLHST